MTAVFRIPLGQRLQDYVDVADRLAHPRRVATTARQADLEEAAGRTKTEAKDKLRAAVRDHRDGLAMVRTAMPCVRRSRTG